MFPTLTHLSATIKYDDEMVQKMKNDDFVTQLLRLLAEAVSSTIVETKIKRLNPQGLIAYALLLESHISLHVWEEVRFAALDIATSAKTKSAPRDVEIVLNQSFPGSEISISVHS